MQFERKQFVKARIGEEKNCLQKVFHATWGGKLSYFRDMAENTQRMTFSGGHQILGKDDTIF